MNDQVTQAETAEILRQAERCLRIEGDFVELGCYRGDTSALLGKLLQSNTVKIKPSFSQTNLSKTSANHSVKSLWLYDSFAGLPEKTGEDSSGAGANFQAGELAVTKREVIDKLHKNSLKTSSRPDPTTSSVIVKKAWFSDLTAADLPDQIAFAFCDGDLYSSIKISLKLVLPHLSREGIIIVHDYNNPELPGSARAVDEFFRAHPDFRLQIYHTLAILTR